MKRGAQAFDPSRRAMIQGVGGAVMLPACLAAGAQPASDTPEAYPNRPVNMLLAGAAGGSSDVITRLVTRRLSEEWGQAFVHENMPGGSGAIASEAASRALPNGYTLYSLGSNILMGAVLGDKAARSVNFRTAFAPITNMVHQPYVMVVSARLPVKSVAELLAYAKSHPAKLNYGSLGVGSATHVGMELIKAQARVDIVHVPYKGTNQVEGDIAAGHIDVLLGGSLSSMAMLKAGKTRALAVTTAARSRLYPDLPTLAESGFPGFNLDAWFGLVAPARTPPGIVNKIHREVARALNAPELRERLASAGAEASPSSSPAEFGAFLGAELDRWEAAGKKLDLAAR